MILFSIIDKKINATLCRLATQNRVIKRRHMASICKLALIAKETTDSINLKYYDKRNWNYWRFS